MTAGDGLSILSSFLLLQFTLINGHTHDDFEGIAYKLKENSLVKNDLSCSEDRLKPDALQTLYFDLLRREILEVEQERGAPITNGTHGAVSPHKLPEEEQDRLAARVTDKLYARYVKSVEESVKADERHYTELAAEIARLENNYRDEVALPQTRSSQTSPPRKQSSISKLINDEDVAPSPRSDTSRPGSAQKQDPAPSPAQARIASLLNPVTVEEQQRYPKDEVRSKVLLPSDQQVPYISRQPVPGPPRPTPPTIAPAPSQRPSQPTADYRAYSPGHGSTTALHSTSNNFPSPVAGPAGIQPPPPGMNSQSPGVAGQWDHLPRMSHSPTQPMVVSPTQRPPYQDQRQPYTQQYPPHPNDIRRNSPVAIIHQSKPSYPPPRLQQQRQQTQQQQQPSSQLHASPQHGGVMLPPLQTAPQAQPLHPQSRTSPVSIVPQAGQQPMIQRSARPDIKKVMNGLAAYQSPTGTPVPSRSLSLVAEASSLVSPGSSTLWKHSKAVSPRRASPDKLRPRSVSPLSDPERSAKRFKASHNKTVTSKDAEDVPQIHPKSGRQTRPTAKGKMSRASSQDPSIATTSISQDRTRSHSIQSQADDLSFSGRASQSYKDEPSTPIFHSDDADDTVLPNTSSRIGRSGITRTSKRKRTGAEEDVLSRQAQTITVSKTFAKVTVPIMNNIQSHKHGSLFSAPVKERDAEGYTSIIKRPTDLKTIRAAITLGNRTVAAATAETLQGSPGTPGGTGNTVVLPSSPDLAPPRAIVTSAQLEQEVMRMLANAVMFNPGTDDVVRDTREMFESVEQIMDAWRAAENSEAKYSGKLDDELDELAQDEEPGPASGKKRRL